MSTARFEHLLKTQKQKAFDRDFLARWDVIEFWDTLTPGVPRRHPGIFEVLEEDVLSYNLAVGETHPLYIDPDYARTHAPHGKILAHPLFTTTIAFWFAQPETQGSWIRTPGSRNPFQRVDYHDRISIGDRLTVVQENVDRFWRRNKAYMTSRVTILDESGKEKAVLHGTLILPPSREAVHAFASA